MEGPSKNSAEFTETASTESFQVGIKIPKNTKNFKKSLKNQRNFANSVNDKRISLIHIWKSGKVTK